jgi:hypothetical protein
MGWHSNNLRIPKAIEMNNPQHKVQVLNAQTGEEYERDMTPTEIEALEATDETPAVS